MNGRTLRRRVGITALSLALGGAPAWAGRGAGPAAQRPVGLLAQARAAFGELLVFAGVLPPGHFTAVWGEEGGYIDPDGRKIASPTACAAGVTACPGESSNADEGGYIDPDG